MAVLKARIGGAWVDVGGAGTSEVEIGTADPIGTNPAAELWYDTDAPAVLTDDTRWNTAWGIVASVTTPGAQTFTALALADVTGLTTTWTPVVGRRYLTTLGLLTRKITAGGDITVALMDGAGGHLIGSVMSLGTNGYGPTAMHYIDVPATATPITRKVQCHPGTASAVTAPIAGYGGTLVVEDIGPVSGAIPVVNPIPAWIPVTFSGVWANYGGIFQTAQYRKIGDIVYLRGVVMRPSGTAQPIFVLPVGYRPPAALQFAEKWFNGSVDAMGAVEVRIDGSVSSAAGAGTGVVNPMSIDCSFSVTA